MDFTPNFYNNDNGYKPSYQYKKNRLIYLNSSFSSDFNLINGKINEIIFDITPFNLYKNNSLKVITFIRSNNQAKPIQFKVKNLLYESQCSYNNDKEAFPTIYTSHIAVESMLNNSYNSLTLLPQLITNFNLKVNDDFNNRDSGIIPEETIITDNNSSIVLNQPSIYLINYETPIKIDKGIYSATFTSNITFNNIVDKSYPLLKDANNQTINPLVWYKFDNSTNLGLDEMGNHNLTNVNSVGYNSTNSIKGTGISTFNGTNQSLNKTNAFNLNGKSFSISFWSYRTNATQSGNKHFFIIGNTVYSGFNFYINCFRNSTGSFQFYFGSDSLVFTTTTTYLNTWLYITLTYNNTNKNAKIYLNGLQVATRTNTLNIQTDNSFVIGALNGNVLNFQGYMDDFRIYEIELTAAQVSELYKGRIQILNPPSFLLGLELKEEDLKQDNIVSIYR